MQSSDSQRGPGVSHVVHIESPVVHSEFVAISQKCSYDDIMTRQDELSNFVEVKMVEIL